MPILNSGVGEANATSYTVTGLTNGTSYYFEVRAVNNADESEPSNEVLGIPQPITTPDKPRAPQVSSGNGRVFVQWLAPLRDGGTPILRYEYCLKPISQCSGQWVDILDSAPGGANHGQYAIARTNGTYTRVYLRAVNAQGAGPHVNRAAVPLTGAPPAPTNLRGETIDAEHVKISWREPSAPAGVTITGYDLEHSRDGVTWAHDFEARADRQQYLGGGRHPPGTTSVTVRIGENATLHYRIRTLFRTTTPTVVSGTDFSQGASPSSPIIEVTTVGAEGTLALPALGVSDGFGREGPNAAIVFDVSLTRPHRRTSPVTVVYRTQDGTARAGSDYTATSGTLSFAAGETAKTVSVPIIDDTVEDSGEEFALQLSNVSGAILTRSGGIGTIYNQEDLLTGFTLVDAASGTDIGSLTDATEVTLDAPATGQYGIRVETVPETGIGSVRLALSRAKTVTRTDNAALYTLYAAGGEGLPPGAYTLQATAYSEPDGGGNALQTRSVSFTVAAATEDEDDGAALSATFPASWFASTRHTGSDDRPQVVVTFSEPLASFAKETPSVEVTGGTIRSFQAHPEDGLENAYVFFVTPDGDGDVTFTLVADAACASGGICTAGGTVLTQVPATVTIPGPGAPAADDDAAADTDDDADTAPASLTAAFGEVPAEHDGQSAFNVRVEFSEDVGISYKALRDESFSVTDGDVTGARRVDGRHDLWEITVEPDSREAVKISLPGGSACGTAGAVCTRGDNPRQLTNSPSATVTGPPDELLTASFGNMPAEHDGSAFSFDLNFSENIRAGYARVRDDAFSVSGGNITKAQRQTQGSNQNWTVTVQPSGNSGVSITLPETTNCDNASAICTHDGRPLSHSPSATVAGPVGISVADARVEEGAGAVLEFAVTLSRAAAGQVTVDYQTADGSAHAGDDYTAANGTLTFEAGESSKTVEVAVLDDSHDEGEETMTLRLSNPSEGRLADAEATGTIENTDPLPRALLARFGRATALHVMEQVEERLEASRASGFRGRFAGRELRRGMERDMGRNFLSRLQSTAVQGARDTTGVQSDLSGSELLRRGLGGGDLLMGSGFVLNRETGAGASVSLWSRGMESRFSGRDGELSLDGGVRTTMFGADYAKGPLMAGLMLSHRRGLGGYQGADVGQVASSVTGLHPWVGYKLTERVTLWGVTGYGRGSLSLTPGEALSLPTSVPSPVALKGGLSMSMLAGGVRGDLVDSGAGGFGLAFKADVLWVGTGSEAVDGPAGRLAGTEAVVTRVRTALEASRGYVVGHGIALQPSLELGLRRDGGDAETGAGADVAGSLIVSDPWTGLSVDVRVRTLLVHQDEGFRERGVSVSFSYDPTPSTPLGLKARVAPSWGGQAMSGADALWGRDTMEGLGAAGLGSGPGSGDRIDAELGYALPVGSRLVGTPRFGVTTSEYGRDYRLGYSLAVVQGSAMSFQFGLDAQRRESLLQEKPDHSLVGRLTVGW